nr:hypothetical protein [Tanacetum cinerariifolium]
DDESKGFDEEEVWKVNEEWLMALVTPPLMPAVLPPSIYEVGGPSTAAAKGQSSLLPASGLLVPPLVIEDLSTQLGNLKEIGPRVSAIEGQVHVVASYMVQAEDELEQVGAQVEQGQRARAASKLMISSRPNCYQGMLVTRTTTGGLRQTCHFRELRAVANELMVGPLDDEIAKPIIGAEEQVIGQVIDMDEDIAMLFVDCPVGSRASGVEIREIHYCADGVRVSAIEGQVHVVASYMVQAEDELEQMQALQAAVQQRDLQIQQLRTTISDMSNHESTLM